MASAFPIMTTTTPERAFTAAPTARSALLPLIMRLLVGADHPPSDYGLAGVILSHLAFLGALAVIYRLTVAVFRDRGMARRTVWIIALAPWAFVFSLAYTESLFLLLS